MPGVQRHWDTTRIRAISGAHFRQPLLCQMAFANQRRSRSRTGFFLRL